MLEDANNDDASTGDHAGGEHDSCKTAHRDERVHQTASLSASNLYPVSSSFLQVKDDNPRPLLQVREPRGQVPTPISMHPTDAVMCQSQFSVAGTGRVPLCWEWGEWEVSVYLISADRADGFDTMTEYRRLGNEQEIQ